MSVAMIFSTTTPASVAAVGNTVANSKAVAPEKSEAIATINESTVSRVEKIASQPSKAGELINNIKDTATYEEALRTVLDNYYINGASENAEKLDSVVDSRGDVIFENYINAQNERKTEPAELGYVPGEVLVVTKPGIKDEEIPDIFTDERMSIDQVLSYTEDRKLVKLSISLEDTVDNAITKLEANEKIEYVEKDQVYTTDYNVGDYINDAKYEELFHLDAIKSVDAWKLLATTDHEKVKVAVIDTGADIEHEDLKNVINKDLSVRITSDGIICPLTSDNTIHGTHVSGIIAAEANNGIGAAGVGSALDNSSIEVIGIGCDLGYGGAFSTISVYKAIKYAVENGARVINMSLGGQGDPNNIFQNAVTLAVNSGCVVVCAAGNENTDEYCYPSDCDGAISVIALDTTCEERVYFSNYGASKNKISAPGEYVYSTIPGDEYITLSGTSMASPVVAAVAGMVLSVNPRLTVDEVKDIIYSTADDINGGGYDDYLGYGRVNAYEAVKKAIEYKSVATPTSLTLSNSKLELAKGATAKLSGTVTPANASQTISYHSKNDGIATVSSDGTVTAKSSGTTEIVACTVNNIITHCEVTVKDAGSTKLQKPTAEPIQTGASTGATITWNAVPNAEYYQIYASQSEDSGYTYIGSTYHSIYSIDMTDLYAVPASTVYFLKVKAVTSDNSISDSELSDTIAYVYTGQEPYLVVEVLAEEGAGKGLFLHWGAIVSAELYRTNLDTNEKVLLKTFGEDMNATWYYDNKGDLEVGTNYKYTLKLFNTYKGVKYYGVEREVSFKYQEDDTVVDLGEEPFIDSISYEDDVIKLTYYTYDEYQMYRFYISNDNGKSWYDAFYGWCDGDTHESTGFNPAELNLQPDTKYMFKYKFYETEDSDAIYDNASAYSNVVAVTTPKETTAPVLSINKNSDNRIILNWTDEHTGEGQYDIFYRKEGSGEWKGIGVTANLGTVNQHDVTSICTDADSTYYFKVKYYSHTADVTFEVDSNVTTYASGHYCKESNIVSYRANIPPKDVCTAEFSKVNDVEYTGNYILPNVTITFNGQVLKRNVDYIAYGNNNKEVGRASITIEGMGEYTGKKVIYFNILEPESEKPVTYTVTYTDYDGTVISTQQVAKNADAVQPATPKRTGYIFMGWSSNGTNITANTTIKATYKKSDAKIYTVTFVDRDNKVISQEKVEFGGSTTPPTPPVFEGYEFTHWNNNHYTNVTNNIVVKAKYKATRFESGTGAPYDPYIISSPEQLDYFSYLINNENAKYGSAYYMLGNSIYYNDITNYGNWGQSYLTGDRYYPENHWEPAGIQLDNGTQNNFRGTFNGDGHSIYGLFVSDLSRSYVGFIGSAQNAVICNLGIENSYFETKGDYVGALVGMYSSLSDEARIQCCFTRDNYIIGDSYVGGFAGEVITITSSSVAKITNCYSENSLVESPSGDYLGGFFGLLHANGSHTMVQRCYTFNVVNYVADEPIAGWFSGDIINNANPGILSVWGCYYGDYVYGAPYGLYGVPYNSYDYYYQPEGIDLIQVVADEFYEADFSHLIEYTDDQNVAYDPDKVWVFSENDCPRLYMENGKYIAEFYIEDELFYFTALKEGEKLNLPYVNVDYGYTTTGWNTAVPEYMPASNMKFSTTLEQNCYTVEFYFNDSLIEYKTYYEGEEIIPPAVADGGHTYWKDLPPVMPNHDIKVYGFNRKLGDINNDGNINIIDALMVMKYTVNSSALNEEERMVADVDLNGKISVLDVLLIQQYIVGAIERF